MIYPSDFESKIGFDRIRHKLREMCSTRLAREEVDHMQFSSEYSYIRHRLSLVTEMLTIREEGQPFPPSGIQDVVGYLVEIKAQGSFMSGERLAKLVSNLDAMAEVDRFFNEQEDERSNATRFPELWKEFSEVKGFNELTRAISEAINRYGEVKDTASPELYDIRQQIRAATGSMQRAMKRVLESAISKGIVDRDATPSIRDGRMVIPIQAGNKYSLNGIIHDESATGKTVYIEPAEVVEAGNRMRQLEMDERREVAKVLIRIADVIRPRIDDIIFGCHKLGSAEFINVLAEYAVEIDAQMPNLENNTEIEWYHAVHPGLLLTLRAQGREVVPLNIHLSESQRILIISGPNAGGKSICLKTVAIVQYMMQCGMLPSLYSNSHMGVFDSIFIDIGDEQSLENDLSTYSSHLKNMKYFLQHTGKRTLLLADEMGSGTEPQIGGAIAQAILADVGKRGCRGVITTHYQNLKSFAESEEGFVNGAMLYDRQHLQPTFELSMGTPGSSFALDIAQKIGLPRNVVENAKEIAGSDYVNLDKYISEITRDRRYWANKRQNIREKEVKLDGILEKYEAQSGDLKAQRKQILNEARREAKEILSSANAQIERTILEIRKAQAEKERTKEVRKELGKFVEELEHDSKGSETPDVLKPLAHKSRKSGTKPIHNPQPKELKIEVGSKVVMVDGDTVGEVVSISGKKAEVVFGQLRTQVALNRLKPTLREISRPKTTTSYSTSTTDSSRQRQLNFKNEIDVRGMRADEALQAVTYFLDDAIQFSAGRIRILHGTGHGILKTLIRQLLKANGAVKKFEDEDVRFGGAGITVVDLE